MTVPDYVLNDGATIPAIGFGTGALGGPDGVDAIVSALQQGYRLVDSAIRYENEGAVGEAIRRAGVPRDELVIVSKLQGRHHVHDAGVRAVHESVYRMGLDHLDLYLIHWPNPQADRYVEAWQTLIELQQQGVVRSIGVCNFLPEHLDRLIAETGVAPAVNQVEVHPYWPQPAQLEANTARGVRTMSWAPIGRRTGLREEPVVVGIAAAHGRTPTQVVLRWHVQLGAIPIPKSATPARQAENIAVFDFELSPEEMAALSSLGLPDGRVSGADPLIMVD